MYSTMRIIFKVPTCLYVKSKLKSQIVCLKGPQGLTHFSIFIFITISINILATANQQKKKKSYEKVPQMHALFGFVYLKTVFTILYI